MRKFFIVVSIALLMLVVTEPSYAKVNKLAEKPRSISIGSAFVWYSEQQQDHVLLNMSNNKISWLRIDVPWSTIDRNESGYDYKVWDEAIEHIQAHGINVLPILGFFPDRLLIYPRESLLPDWQEFVETTVKRYPSITHWEIWNEPNSYAFWESNADPCLYGKYLETAYDIIKSNDSNDKVLYGGTMRSISPGPKDMDPYRFLEISMQCGADGHFDIYNYHPYTYPYLMTDDIDDKWFDCPSQIEKIFKLVKKPVWVTETGAPTGLGNGALSEQQQADVITSGLEYYTSKMWIKNWFVYTWVDGADLYDIGDNFGLFRNDWTPKPAWNVFVSYDLRPTIVPR